MGFFHLESVVEIKGDEPVGLDEGILDECTEENMR